MYRTVVLLVLLAASYEVSSQLIDCGVTGCHAGQIINTVSEKRIYDALGTVLSGGGYQKRKCALGIGNVEGARLVKPRWYTHSGMIVTAAPFELPRRKSVLLLFTKIDFGFKGTEGLLSYEIEGSDLKLVAMWAILDNEDSPNFYNMKVYPKSMPLDSSLYNQMQSLAGVWESEMVNVTSKVPMKERFEYGVKLRAHMTYEKKAIMTVTVDTSGLDADLGPERYVTCEHKSFSGNRCRLVCAAIGQCWTSEPCETEAECDVTRLNHCC